MVSTLSKLRDWDIKGFQLQKTYLDDWVAMKHIFHRYGLDINIHGPLLTMSESRNVKYAKYITNELYKDFNINKKEIFLIILRIFPKYARIHAEKHFTLFIRENLLDLIEVSRNGSLKDSDERLEIKVRELTNGK